ncbi:AMP-binding protein [Aquisediminimonas profunda]|uniref:AMP-binding protein n=1 Tax=Aquisediminimonas profunda TaxID=1550733 RepID=UPI001C62555B|nr:AMP-binding protein [Aquisediminimonas profunda]
MTALFEAIERYAMAKCDAVAIEGKDSRLTWRALAEAVKSCRPALNGLPGRLGRAVALAQDHGPSACVTDIALLEAGVPALPLPAFFTIEQRQHAIASAGVAALFGSDDDPARFQALEQQPVDLPVGTAKISFTSGSTGNPKGICLSADHLLGVAQAVVNAVGQSHAGRHLAVLPPGILLENVAGFYAVMLAGGTYVALPQADIGLANPFQPDFLRLLDCIQQRRITSLILVPEYLNGLTSALEATGRRLPDLTLVAVGGARVSRDLIDRASARGLPVRQGYGLTECASVVALEGPKPRERGSVGRSLGLNAISLAEDGEIVIDGPLCLGAIGSPSTPGPYRTGDIGRIDAEGNLWIEGRKSNLIITSHGRNISPEWVESELTNQPGILQAMVFGDGLAELGALIVPSGAMSDLDGAVAAANARLPAYARIGHFRHVAPFTPMNGMLTGNGRLKRQAIFQAYVTGERALPFFDRLVAETVAEQKSLAAVPQLQAGLAGQIDRATYIAYLTQAYHHVRHTVPLLKAARSRLADKPLYARALDDYIEEETGHEHWILADIAAAGGDAQAAAASPPNPATAAMVAHAYNVVENGNAAGFFGMVYVLEGTSIALASNGASAVQSSLGLPPEAFSYLQSHGALDIEHMKFFARLMNSVDDPADQEAILAMAKAMFGLFGGMFASIPMEQFDEAA